MDKRTYNCVIPNHSIEILTTEINNAIASVMDNLRLYKIYEQHCSTLYNTLVYTYYIV